MPTSTPPHPEYLTHERDHWFHRAAALPLYVLDREQFAAWKDSQPAATQAWLASQGFNAGAHSVALLPGADGRPVP